VTEKETLTRRSFLAASALSGAVLTRAAGQTGAAAGSVEAQNLEGAAAGTPWYRKTLRWGQTNITERDPARYDIAWWRSYWKRTRVQGVIINAGGIVAYYPSRFPLHQRAAFLGDRDLYGDLAKAAHEEGLVVLARMDSNRAGEAFFKAHPDWFTRDEKGQPYRAADKFITCVNSGYYEEYLPGVLAEIIERSRPEGITDNSWSGLGRESICYCGNCERRFREKTRQALPKKHDWDDPAYRAWIEWNYERRLEIWDLNNRVTRAAGGASCVWAGMNSGSIVGQSRSFRDYKGICERAEILMLDHQTRNEHGGFGQNAEVGKLIHGLLGWEKLIPESMAMYQASNNPLGGVFRLAAKPAAEARMWMAAGFAGGIQPWWHHIGAYQEDRRAYRTAEAMMRWHERWENVLVNRTPKATVGVVWSQRNTDFFGRAAAGEVTEMAYRGMIHALVRARIPYIPVHADHIERDAGKLHALVLPNLGTMTDAQCQSVRRFAEKGGGVLGTGLTSLYDQWGDPRRDFGLGDVWGAHWPEGAPAPSPAMRVDAARNHRHSYLRLAPELRSSVDGPRTDDEPRPGSTRRHEVLNGFEETDILGYGGMLYPLRVEPDSSVPFTFIPPFPIYPPETAWMNPERTDVPGIVLRETPGGGRAAYLAADLDNRYARYLLPDHGALLENLVRWVSRNRIPLRVSGAGLFDCHLYRQENRLLLHVLHLSHATGRAVLEDHGPPARVQASFELGAGMRARSVRTLVSEEPATLERKEPGWASVGFTVREGHELVLLELEPG
jgi:hypothetical protein